MLCHLSACLMLMRNYFGEGINDEGASLSWLIPNSHFYQELVLQVTDGPIDNPSFSRSVGNTYLELLHLKNFFDLSSNATLEVGLSGITGANQFDFRTNVAAIDLTYKWKPVRLIRTNPLPGSLKHGSAMRTFPARRLLTPSAMYSFINFQFSKRWFFTGMYSYSNSRILQVHYENSYSRL